MKLAQLEKAEWIRVASDAVRKVRYHRERKWLDLQYVDGETYRYENTTAAEFRELLDAESIGAYVNQVFKPAHLVYRKIRF